MFSVKNALNALQASSEVTADRMVLEAADAIILPGVGAFPDAMRMRREKNLVDVLRQAGAEVLGIASIFTYGMKKSVDRLAEANVKNVSLTDLDTVAQVAAAEGYIRPEDQQRLLKFRENPSDESWIQK